MSGFLIMHFHLFAVVVFYAAKRGRPEFSSRNFVFVSEPHDYPASYLALDDMAFRRGPLSGKFCPPIVHQFELESVLFQYSEEVGRLDKMLPHFVCMVVL